VTGKAEQPRATAIGQAIERAVAAALDRHLTARLDRHHVETEHAAERGAERAIEAALGTPRASVRRWVRDVRVDPAVAAAWIEGHFDTTGCSGNVRSNLSRWRNGKTAWVRKATLERMARELGGDPADVPDELPAADAPDQSSEPDPGEVER
jgi:hypothetical protein